MKTLLFPAVFVASLAILGCAQPNPSTGTVTASSASPASTDHGSHSSASGSTTSEAARTDSPATAAETPVSGTYGKKETYSHADSDVSVTALIAGGVTSSGAAVAPSATVIEGRLQEWRLLPEDVAAELTSGRPIVRVKARGPNPPPTRSPTRPCSPR